MDAVSFNPTKCAICETFDNAREIYKETFHPHDINPTIFSARRMPDCIHYRMVKCESCGLVRSDPRADDGVLEGLYRESSFDYSSEVESLKKTYGAYLTKIPKRKTTFNRSLLEIGCGNGFFLEEAIKQGYGDVRGVEPSSHAAQSAKPGIDEKIIVDIMRPGLFEEGTFDVICIFQAFDHLSDPGAVLDECFKVLKPGGFLLILNHNINAFSATILGEKSPIIDIEHTYLYDPWTLKLLAATHKFKSYDGGAVWSYYPLQYVARLVPFPSSVKVKILNFLQDTGIGKIVLRVPLGNLWELFIK